MKPNVCPVHVQVLLFAGARNAIGRDCIDVELPSGETLATLRKELAMRFPALAELVERSRFAIQSEFKGDDTVLDQPVEVAWIPPVSGG